MSVLSAEGPRCDSTEWVWGIFLAAGIANRSMAVEALTAWAVPPAQCSGGGFGDRNVLEPRPVEMTLRCRSAEPGMRDAVCNPRQLCLWGCFAAVGTVGGMLPLKGWIWVGIPVSPQQVWGRKCPHCSSTSPRERAPMHPSLLQHRVTGCCSPGAAPLPQCFPAHLGMGCCLRINNLTGYEGTLADTIVPVKSNCL